MKFLRIDYAKWQQEIMRRRKLSLVGKDSIGRNLVQGDSSGIFFGREDQSIEIMHNARTLNIYHFC